MTVAIGSPVVGLNEVSLWPSGSLIQPSGPVQAPGFRALSASVSSRAACGVGIPLFCPTSGRRAATLPDFRIKSVDAQDRHSCPCGGPRFQSLACPGLPLTNSQRSSPNPHGPRRLPRSRRRRRRIFTLPSRAAPRRWSRRWRSSSSPAASTGTRSSRTPMPAAASRSGRATRSSSAPTTPSTSAAASPSAATSGSRRSIVAPRLFNRRGVLSVLGGWREATQVGFYGIGTPNTSVDDRANYSFRQPYLSAVLEVRPTRRLLIVGGGLEYSQWEQRSGAGLGAVGRGGLHAGRPCRAWAPSRPTCSRTRTVAFDWRPAAGYARRGGYYGVTCDNYADQDGPYSFRQVDYEAIQHMPILTRRVGAVAARPRPDDLHEGRRSGAVLHAAVARRRIDAARLRRAGASATATACCCRRSGGCWSTASSTRRSSTTPARSKPRRGDLDLDGLKSDYGIGFRLHGPFATPVRIELAQAATKGSPSCLRATAAF